MALPDSTTQAPVFVTDQPDWSKGIQLVSSYMTGIASATSGADQRAKLRARPRCSFSYTIGALTVAQFAQRRSKMLAELQAPVVVPIWTDAFVLTSMVDANTPQLTVALAAKKFKATSYCYFVQGSNTSFRLINAVNSTTLTLAAGSFPTYTAGALVYPCIFGRRKSNKNTFKLNGLNDSDETVSFEEL